MSEILKLILNYLKSIILIFIMIAITSLPVVGIIYLLEKKFKKLNKKHSFVKSLFFINIIIIYLILLLIYFIPAIPKFAEFQFLEALGFIFFHIIRLALVSALFSAIVVIIEMFISLLYEKFNKKTKVKKKLSFINLWKSTTLVLFTFFCFIVLIFPKFFVLLLYLVLM